MANISPATVQQVLSGVDYPADKDSLIQYAEEQEADENIVDVIRQLPDRVYARPTDVSQALAELI